MSAIPNPSDKKLLNSEIPFVAKCNPVWGKILDALKTIGAGAELVVDSRINGICVNSNICVYNELSYQAIPLGKGNSEQEALERFVKHFSASESAIFAVYKESGWSYYLWDATTNKFVELKHPIAHAS